MLFYTKKKKKSVDRYEGARKGRLLPSGVRAAGSHPPHAQRTKFNPSTGTPEEPGGMLEGTRGLQMDMASASDPVHGDRDSPTRLPSSPSLPLSPVGSQHGARQGVI